MKKLLFVIMTILPAMVFAQPKPAKIVMVISSYGKDMGKLRPGFEMDEFSLISKPAPVPIAGA